MRPDTVVVLKPVASKTRQTTLDGSFQDDAVLGGRTNSSLGCHGKRGKPNHDVRPKTLGKGRQDRLDERKAYAFCESLKVTILLGLWLPS